MAESNLPFVSIIIPTYRRPERLAVCLQSLACLEYSRDRFEVIVVDDGSPTPPQSVVAEFSAQLDVRLLTQAHAGPAMARNTGAAKAKGEILAFTDDDCEPAADWLQQLAIRFATTPACAIGGRTRNALSENIFSTASQMLLDYLYDYYNADPSQSQFFASNNLALPADLFLTVGAFDSNFPHAAAEDREFCDRWILNGYRMIYAREVVVYHAHALTFRTFWKQHFTYGHGASYFHRVRRWRGQRRPGLEPPPFYLKLLHHPFSKSLSPRALLIAMLFMVSRIANAAGYFVCHLKNESKSAES